MRLMKNAIKMLAIVMIIIVSACKKEKITGGQMSLTSYSNLSEFYNTHEVKKQTFNISVLTGGTFTSSNGTIVTIPANAFVTSSGILVTGNVTIEFKDIYKKSDMLLSNIPSMLTDGRPLKSAGEFFIRVLSNNSPVSLANGKKITIAQPAANSGGELDSAMIPFVQPLDSNFGGGWTPTIEDSLTWLTTSYVYSLYNYSGTASNGTWCNSDNSSYFSAYSQATLNLVATNQSEYSQIEVYLIFKNINSCVHVYPGWNGSSINYIYQFAPIGLECTAVAVSVKDGKLHAVFTPIVISANQTISFSLSEMNENTFLNQLNALN